MEVAVCSKTKWYQGWCRFAGGSGSCLHSKCHTEHGSLTLRYNTRSSRESLMKTMFLAPIAKGRKTRIQKKVFNERKLELVPGDGETARLKGRAPQAREVCVVPQEQCGVATLCDLPTAEGQGSPLPKTAGCLCPRLLAYGQPQYQSAPLATAGDCKVYRLLQGKWNASSIPSAPPAAAVRCLLCQFG